LRIVLAHNRYRQNGGEDVVFAAEAALLRRFGHEVTEFVKNNNEIDSLSRFALLRTTIWSSEIYSEFSHLLQANRPDVVHFHNTLPLISPAAIHAAKALGIATVQTLHNYRLLCPNGLFYRNARPCEDCMGRHLAWPGILHACYHNSRPATAAIAAMLAVHHRLRTWTDKVDLHIALTEFGRQKFIAGGMPAEKIVVKPNFLACDPGSGTGDGRFAIFVGRLTAEKGIRTLLAAWQAIQDRLPLKIVGSGPLGDVVAAAAAQTRGIAWLGERTHPEVLDLIGKASVLVMPSEWYEPFGLAIIEAFAKATPVIGADIGSIGALIRDGGNGYLFKPGDPNDLAAKTEALIANPTSTERMRTAARQTYEEGYTAERNYAALMRIYESAIEVSRQQAPK
jgi:glycosyltransferase involved in cell wall biosynthesis